MKIVSMKLKNFRGYNEEVLIAFCNLTAFVGKNDIGKSSILEALDIFFNDGRGNVKLDKDDINKHAVLEGDSEIYNKIFMQYDLHIRQSLFEKLSIMNAKDYNKYNLGDIKKRLIDDIDVIERFMGSYVPDLIYCVLYVVGILCFLIYLNWILAIVSILMVPISFGINKLLSKKSKIANEKYRHLSGECSGFLHHIMQNWKEVKTSNLQKIQTEKYQTFGTEIFELSVKKEKYRTANLTLNAIKEFFITKMILYFVGGILIMAERMTVGALLIFVNYYEAFYANISRIMEISFSYETDKASISRVSEIIEFVNDCSINDETNNYKINIENISFRYSGDADYVITTMRCASTPIAATPLFA